MDMFRQRHLPPMLIAEEKPAFDDPGWIFELKWDGTRCIAYLDPDEGLHLENKRFKILTPGFPELREIHRQVKGRCILDGELFVYEDGKVNFAEMQRRSLMNHPLKIQLAAGKLPVSFVAFDLLYLDGESLTGLPLVRRKELLQAAVTESERLAVARYLDGKGIELYRMTAQQELEGIIAKRKDSLYYPGRRTKEWVKCKNWMDDDFVVCGFYFKADNLVSVILGSYRGKHLICQGHVVMGVSRSDYRRMSQAPSARKHDYYAGFPDFEDAIWLKPVLVCRVEFMERTNKGGLRQPAFRGLRDDKSPDECILHG